MRNTIYILSLFVAITISCKSSKSELETANNYPKEFPFTESTYTVLNRPSGWQRIFKNAEPTELSQNELYAIEEILKKAIKNSNEQQMEYLRKHNEEYPKSKRTESGYELSLNKHLRQYLPVINENGEKEIWINFFCHNWNSDSWKTNIVKVFDGGNCYFNLKVNLSTGLYSIIMINGYG